MENIKINVYIATIERDDIKNGVYQFVEDYDTNKNDYVKLLIDIKMSYYNCHFKVSHLFLIENQNIINMYLDEF